MALHFSARNSRLASDNKTLIHAHKNSTLTRLFFFFDLLLFQSSEEKFWAERLFRRNIYRSSSVWLSTNISGELGLWWSWRSTKWNWYSWKNLCWCCSLLGWKIMLRLKHIQWSNWWDFPRMGMAGKLSSVANWINPLNIWLLHI